MGLPTVNVEIQSGGLGRIAAQEDRVCALVINGVADQPLQIFSLEDAKNHATRADANYVSEYDRQIADFFKEAGAGAELWLQPVNPATSTAVLFSGGVMSNLIERSGGRINVVGFSRYLATEPASPALVSGIDADCMNALDDAQAFAEYYAALHMPLRIIMDGKYMSATPATLTNLKSLTYNRVAVCVASNKQGAKNACMGQLLGRIAASPVNQSIARLRSGQILIDEAYTTGGQVTRNIPMGDIATVGDKGYILFRRFIGKGGFYFNEDHMACPDTDDFATLANGRVIDKVARIAYATFVEELLDTVPVDEKGKILKTTIKQYQSNIERAIGLTMGAAGEISNVDAFIDPNQDILATSKLIVDLRITPTGTNRVILVKLGLYNPNAA
ncbi:DUF2586 family protein [Spirosoma lituiforme]